MATEVGTAYATILPSAKGFAKALQRELAKELANADLDKLIGDALGKRPLKLPVQPDFDPKSVPDEVPVPRNRKPKLPVELDPLLAQFQGQVKRDLAALTREVNANIPLTAETAGLRSELARQITAVEKQLKAEIPTEPAGQREYEAQLGDLLAEVQRRVKAELPVEPVVDPASVPQEVPVPRGRAPKLPVELDPLVAQFRSQVKRQVAELSREVNANIPVTPETAGLRSELAAQIASIERQMRAEIPTDPAGQREYEARLRALVAQVSERVRASVRVEPEVERTRFRTQLMQGISGALGQVSGAASTMAGVVSNATSSLTGLATAMLAAGAASTMLVSGSYLLGGALGSLPGIIAGAMAAVAALRIGLIGISEAFEDAGGSGGGAGVNLAAQARQIAQATRGLESAQRSLARAQREVVLAQEAVTRARADEAERLQDLNRSVARARLDEEDAALRVRDAERALALARRTGNVEEIERADLAYRQALLGLEEAKDATEDLAAEQERAAKAGVEGSDQVRSALRRQEDALDGLIAANEQLLSAEEALQAAREKPAGGGGGVAQELTKLAPAAQKFVDQVKALAPAFDKLRLNVQQKLFAGLDKSVKQLATAWLPQLNKTLGDYADTFNGLAKRAADSMSKKSFIDNIGAGAESARKALKRMGDAITGPLVDAFGRLSRSAGPFIEKLGEEVGKLIEDFSKWIEKLDKSGELDKFFERASEIFSDLMDMFRDIGSIFGSIVKILFNDGDQTVTNSPWESLKETLDGIATWFKDPKNQEKIRDWIDKIKEFLTEDLPAAIRTAKNAIDTVDGWLDTVEEWRQRIVRFRDDVRNNFAAIGLYLRQVTAPIGWALREFTRLRTGALLQVSGLVTWMRGLPGRIRSALGDTGRMLYQAGRNILQGLINGLRAMFGPLESTLTWVTNRIPDWKGPADRDRRLLEPAGEAIMRGLIRGIDGQVPALRSELGTVTDIVAGTPLGSPAAGLSVSSAAVPAPAVLGFGGDAPDSFLRWLRDNVRIYYGGSAQAAIGS